MKKLQGIAVGKTLQEVEHLLETDKTLSSGAKALITMLLLVVRLLLNRLGLNSENSSTPPSQDLNRKRGRKGTKTTKKPGGQAGHVGTFLEPVENPDRVEEISVDRSQLPPGDYCVVGYEARQVFDIEINRVVTEYRAQILEDEFKKRHVAQFPKHVTSNVQYGLQVKAHAVYMSQYQLLPYDRVCDYFAQQMHLPLSAGTLFNFNKSAYELLERFETIAKKNLINGSVLNADETGININKKKHWLHVAANPLWTHFYPHQKRGSEAMDEVGILTNFKGIMVHDHWSTYYTYVCTHSLCNAHHLRELECAFEQDKQQWAETMAKLLIEIKTAVEKSPNFLLPEADQLAYRKRYREILNQGKAECPLPAPDPDKPKKRGRIKKSKSRNLLERLEHYENDVLRFMVNPLVPFTNNLAENDLRMTKVQQKISGCFRSIEGALIFCRIRGYLSTCRKHDVSMTDALALLFQGKMPAFVEVAA